MKIKWYAHSSFRLTNYLGVAVIIDPYKPGGLEGAINYGLIEDTADAVLISHGHEDHNYTDGIRGNFTIIRKAGTYNIGGMVIKAIQTEHGAGMGNNLAFVIRSDGITVVHLGDTGYVPGKNLLAEVGGRIDVLVMPVDGIYTLTLEEAAQMINEVRPSYVLPMHFRTEKACRGLGGVEAFLKDKERTRRIGRSEFEIDRENLPDSPEILLLQYER
jgi:L-ascorbate metabolism protein UlaG (beta-lactamase superfamily)